MDAFGSVKTSTTNSATHLHTETSYIAAHESVLSPETILKVSRSMYDVHFMALYRYRCAIIMSRYRFIDSNDAPWLDETHELLFIYINTQGRWFIVQVVRWICHTKGMQADAPVIFFIANMNNQLKNRARTSNRYMILKSIEIQRHHELEHVRLSHI